MLMIISHVFLKNNLLVTKPKARPRREYDWGHESMDLDSGSGSGMNTAYTLADCSRDHPTRERPGEKQGDLAYVSALPWER